MTVSTFKLTGEALVKFFDQELPNIARGEITRTDLIIAAGYVYENGKARYTEFYEELLRAQGRLPVTDTDVINEAYDNLDKETQALYDAVDKQFGEKWDHEEVMEFIGELEDIGIETAEQFEDRFYGVYDTEKEFAEEFSFETGAITEDSPLIFAIDWERVWDHSLRYDFNSIAFDYEYYFFHNY